MNHDPSRPDLSWIALNRLAEEKAAEDPGYRKELQRQGRRLLSRARQLSDAELLGQLRAVGIELDRTTYASVAERVLSAEQACAQVVTPEVRARFKRSSQETDVWLALTVLWERWFPQWPNFERLDDRIQQGYALEEADPAVACEKWFTAWADFLRLFDKGGFRSIAQFDKAFRGTQSVFNWVQDFETALLNASVTDAQWHRRRIEFCQQFLQRFESEDRLATENMRRSMAEARVALGDRAAAEALFAQWLQADPQWGGGWIGWSDCYAFLGPEADRDLQRAEALLKQGLAVAGVRDRADLLDRLEELYRAQGRAAEAEQLHRQPSPGAPQRQPVNAPAVPSPPESNTPVRRPKIGRNEPCPCGSGKKYKKCCLPKDEAQARQAAAAAAASVEPAAPAPSAPAPSEAELDLAGPERWAEDAQSSLTEARLPAELEAKLDQLWEDFEALEEPSPSQWDEFLSQLLALPPEGTDWNDLLHYMADRGHPDLPSAFRRIASTVPHTEATSMGFFYWAAAEEFDRLGLRHLLPEVAAGFRRLDLRTYNPDALAHLEDYLLAAGFETETLQLAEQFLPIERADQSLLPHVVPQGCGLIFELRVGQAVRSASAGALSPDELVAQLRRDIEEEVAADGARLAADIITGQAPEFAWTRQQFDLVTAEASEDPRARQGWLRLFGALIRVAQEAWQLEGYPPGCLLCGLSHLLDSVHRWNEDRPHASRTRSDNLLDYLRPTDLEERLVRSCRDIIGVNKPRAQLLLDAHQQLGRCAARHQLLSTSQAQQLESELARLRQELTASP